jgi:hypothetical protein
LAETPTALITDKALIGSRAEGSIEVFNSQTYITITLNEKVAPSKSSISELSNQIWQKSFPAIIRIDDKNYARYRNNRKPLFMAWFELNSPSSGDLLKSFTEIANKFPQFAFGYVDYEEKKERLYKLGGFKQIPNTIIRVDFSTESSYIYEGKTFSVDAVSEWISGIVSGSVKANVLSEPSKQKKNLIFWKNLKIFFFITVPENNDGPVQKIVGLNFDQIVFDSNKDVLIQYYIDWCQGCKYLQSFDKVGELMKGIDDVVVGKIDFNINDITEMHLEIYGNPTIALYPRNDKKNPIVYSGSQTSDDLLLFLKRNTLSEKAKAVPDLPVEKVELPDFFEDDQPIKTITKDEL